MRRIGTVSIFSRSNSDTRLFVLMLIVIVVITIDSQIGYVADFIPEQLSSNVGVFTFVVIAVIFVITQYLILDYVKRSNKEAKERARHISKLHTGVTVAQYLLASVVAIVILQILLTQEYNTISLYIVYAISFGLWILILALLAKAFLSWYKLSGKNVMVLIFTLSMIVYVVNGIAALAENFYMLGQQKKTITSVDVAYFPEFSIESAVSQVGIINNISSIAAYILTWIGTVKMLYPYIKKLGKTKF
jgi:hypothetical protein